MAIVFEQVDGTNLYDLKQDGRALEYDVEPEDFAAALRRRRIPSGAEIFVVDETGYRTRLTPRRRR